MTAESQCTITGVLDAQSHPNHTDLPIPMFIHTHMSHSVPFIAGMLVFSRPSRLAVGCVMYPPATLPHYKSLVS